MDFEYHYTTEQERFRQEVQAWLEQNVPDDLTAPVDPEDMSEEQHQSARALHKKLAAKGWLYPTYPKEYGGGGLSAEHETILEEEFLRKRVIRPFTNGLVFPTLLV